MKEQIEKAVKVNAEKAAGEKVSGDEAMKYTQAALNAAHVLSVLGQLH